MNTEELKAAEAALEEALDKVRQLIASGPEPKPEPKPEPVRGPLTVAPEYGTKYWSRGWTCEIDEYQWDNGLIDRARLDRGEVFASREDADYKAAFDAIWGQPIGEWEPDSCFWHIDFNNDPMHSPVFASRLLSAHRFWRNGEIGFGDAGKAELERRLAEQKALDERYGL